MTEQEAIEILNILNINKEWEVFERPERQKERNRVVEAFDLAIQSLKNEARRKDLKAKYLKKLLEISPYDEDRFDKEAVFTGFISILKECDTD